MNAEHLRGRAVVSVQQAEKLGPIEDVLLDLQQHRVGGLLLRGALFRQGHTVPWSEVRTVGLDAVMVESNSAAVTSGNQGPLAGLIRLTAIRGMKVVTDSGELAGTVDGAEIDTDTGQITNYLVAAPAGGGLFHAKPHFMVPPSAVAGIGSDMITVDSRVIDFQREPPSSGSPASQ